jgi:hypothetical protein
VTVDDSDDIQTKFASETLQEMGVGKWGRGGYYIIKHLKEKGVGYGQNSFFLKKGACGELL